MLPLAMALGEGSEQRAPMGRAVIGGLITSTLLTLFVVPVVYTLLDDLVNRVFRRVGTRPATVQRPSPLCEPEAIAAGLTADRWLEARRSGAAPRGQRCLSSPCAHR